MEQISGWILSIAGIICISVIIELLLPNGQMNRYIKGVLSFLVILIVIMPIPKLLNKDFDFSNIFNNEIYEIDSDYLYQVNIDKMNGIKETIENKVEERGYKNVSVYLNCDIFDNTMQFKSIYVDLSDLVISENAEHNNITKIKKDISNIIMTVVDIDEEAILYDG